ncbi:DUF262 domain-containing protein [Leekyejoonella antrihumi]|uniref:DUF262 domain-containing protein n=1 Tax=Leekyejoonella antrihumi TaxID=1660198 RepID=A0A563DV78_9MICO|nr:DUF262 domain-containing protein [Leekyejoonella antrihumi]TWP34096.1 DUF262 domain-containing protein [Leekyejoonella antrihumi]
MVEQANAEAEAGTPDDTEVLDETEVDDDELVETEEATLKHFGADFDIAGLVRRLNDGDIIIPRFDPDESDGASISGFQRQGVWTSSRMEKFIESLLLGWPVPSIFLVLDEDQRYLVLDGQQRLTTLQAFFSGFFPNGKKFVLKDVADHLKQATYETLSQESRRRLHNTFIQTTVIEPKGDPGRDSVYKLFGRLNSGGVSLTAQEIRVALYRGPVVDWIRDLNHDVNWRRLFGSPHARLKDHELILRSMALCNVISAVVDDWQERDLWVRAYRPPMSEFLNSYLKEHKSLSNIDRDKMTAAFSVACRLLVEAGGTSALRYQGTLNAAHVDAVMASLLYAASMEKLPTKERVKDGLNSLRGSDPYRENVTRSTSHRENVIGRLREATAAFDID